MLEELLFAVLVLVLNVLDSVTTSLAFKQYPDRELKGEANPVMRWLMLKSRTLAEIVKQGFVASLVSYWLVSSNVVSLRIAGIALGLVVLNNLYIVVARALTKKKIASPTKLMMDILHLSEAFAYSTVLVVLCILTAVIYVQIWGEI